MTTEQQEPKVEAKAEPTTADLLAQIKIASEAGDLDEVVRLGNQLKKFKADIEKAQQAKLQAEAEALAKDREKLAKDLFTYVSKYPGLKDALDAVKATGFDMYTTQPDANGVDVKAHCALKVPTIKKKRSGGGGGGTGVSTKDQVGMSLSELIDAYGTEEEKAEIQAAYDNAEANKGSAKWQKQNQVKKRILADNPALIKA